MKSKLKTYKKKGGVHWSHVFALLILVSYFSVSKLNMAHAMTNQNKLIAFLQIYLFGIFFACLFLYLFSHERFFPIAKQIEKEEEKKEKKYLKKYIRHGKVLATFIIGTLGGPVFSSLTARLLLNNTNFLKYFIVVLANIPSTVVTVGIANGFVKIFNF